MEKDWSERLIVEVCKVLKERRLKLGVSIYHVSQASGVSQQAIANYEKLLRRPTLDCLAKVADALCHGSLQNAPPVITSKCTTSDVCFLLG